MKCSSCRTEGRTTWDGISRLCDRCLLCRHFTYHTKKFAIPHVHVSLIVDAFHKGRDIGFGSGLLVGVLAVVLVISLYQIGVSVGEGMGAP